MTHPTPTTTRPFGLIAAYPDRVAVAPGARIVTLGEGDTPLVPAPALSERTGCVVYLKVEGANPTGSFKDRGMTVALTQALARGARAYVTATVMPRSLNDPVGLAPSTFRYTVQPVRSDRAGAGTSGVPPSPRVTTRAPGGTATRSG
jgi:hypothetical protein